MKLIIDMSSVLWTCLLVGKDVEAVSFTNEAGDVETCNSPAYCYENAVNLINKAISDSNCTPMDCILVFEGHNSKQRRVLISKDYKAQRGNRSAFVYEQWNTAKQTVRDAYLNLGAIAVSQDFVEADDVIGWLAQNLPGPKTVMSNDNDLVACMALHPECHVRINGVLDFNKFGIEPRNIAAYKALVGDTSDNIKGVRGFGQKAFEAFVQTYGEEGLDELTRLAELGSLGELADDENPIVRRIVNGEREFLDCYRLAKLQTTWVNTLQHPLQWQPGLLRARPTDERLTRWGQAFRLVGGANYTQALAFLRAKVPDTPWFSLDLETSVPEESDEWLANNGMAVDVLASKITGASILFGNNLQYSYYITVNHKDSDNVSVEQLGELFRCIPSDKLTVAHNAAGFELPVLYKEFGSDWKDNGWRGFFPNMVDSRIAAVYWDENQPAFGLKPLTKLLFNYDQETYQEVTKGRKMDQIPASEVTHYGCDDVYTSAAIWNFCKLIMDLEGTYKAFMEYEQLPMYLQALSYVQGVNLDVGHLSTLAAADKVADEGYQRTIHEYLISKAWDGSVCPVFTALEPKDVKQAAEIVLGVELKAQVRMLPKLAAAIRELTVDDGAKGLLAQLVETADLEGVNRLMASRFTAKPELNTGSPLQLQRLLYEVMGLPVRLRNKPTDVMRAKGIRQGTPRTDEDAILMAIKLGDADKETEAVLRALVESKSIRTRTGLYWEAYPKLLHWTTNRLHPELRQSSTNTRRYTGSNPNIQQMDSNPDGVRSCILPHHRRAVVVSLDESAQEVRMMADLCRDSNLLTCFLGRPDELRDVHSIVGSQIAGCSYEDFVLRRKAADTASAYSAIRQKAKQTFFAWLFGAMAPKIAEGLGIETSEAQEYIDAIYIKFPGVKAWKESVEEKASTIGTINLHGGTTRHLGKLVTSDNAYEASKAMRQAGNASIQSPCASQMKRIMSRIWQSDLLDKYDYRWYFSVHDESVHSIGKQDAEAVIPVLHGFMTEQFLKEVPSKSSVGLGKNFGQLMELGEDYDPKLVTAALEKLEAK